MIEKQVLIFNLDVQRKTSSNLLYFFSHLFKFSLIRTILSIEKLILDVYKLCLNAFTVFK